MLDVSRIVEELFFFLNGSPLKSFQNQFVANVGEVGHVETYGKVSITSMSRQFERKLVDT